MITINIKYSKACTSIKKQAPIQQIKKMQSARQQPTFEEAIKSLLRAELEYSKMQIIPHGNLSRKETSSKFGCPA